MDELPASISSFVGRAAELQTLAALLSRHRLVTLVGPGGTGKTRLTVEALRRDPHGVRSVFVPLEPVRTPSQLLTTVAAALGVRDPAQELAAATVAAALGDQEVRLVLDGAEVLADEVRDLLPRLLEAAPGLSVVTTSRRVLGVAGEIAWTVPQLSCPTGADASGSDAVALFLARARERVPDLDPDLAVVGELCRRLGGLPLAIELTAAWTGTLTVEQILRERAELLGSGDSLDSVIQSSYALLGDAERALLAALAVFAGEFTFDDARAVADPAETGFAAQLRALVDSSWLAVHDAPGERRFVMLETVREFGRARLRAGRAEPAVRRRHGEHFAELARGSEEGLAGADLARWAGRMRAADADILDALRWAREAKAHALGLEMAAALWRWWLSSGQLVTGRRWLDTMLETAGDRSDAVVGKALTAAAILAAENGDPAAAVDYATRALRILDRLDDVPAAALAATILGSAQRYLGDEAASRHHFETALRLRRRLGDERGEAAALNNLALLSLDTADLDEAGRLLQAALVIKRRLGEDRSIALGLCNLSEVLVRTGALDDAELAIAEAQSLAAALNDKQLDGGLLCNAGDLAARRGEWDRALDLYREALRVHGEAGNEHDVVVAVVGLGRALHHLGATGEALSELRRAEAMAERAGNAQRLAYTRVALAEVTGVRSAAPPPGVTARQAEVLGYVAAGLSNREIAESLHLSVATVERHLATVYRNLGLRGRVAAARFANEHGLVPTPRTM